MKTNKLKGVLENHQKWLDKAEGGKRANLTGTNLTGANLRYANLTGANLTGATLTNATLSGANLHYANLSGATLTNATLSGANLGGATLSGATLTNATLSGATLTNATLSGATLTNATLRWADLTNAYLTNADLTGAIGLPDAPSWCGTHLQKTVAGYIAYKTFGSLYDPPEHWIIEPDSILTEICDTDRRISCGAGVNVATLEWVKENNHKNLPIWKLLIRNEWVDSVVVPYATDGKLRCSKVELIRIIQEG